MRFIRISIWVFATLALASSAHAQSSGAGSANQMERDITLSAPQLPDSTPDLTKSLQAELKRVGCLEGAADGQWNDKTKAALVDFARRSKLEVPTDAVTSIAVEALQSRRDRVCPLDCGAGRVERNGQCVTKAAPAPRPAKPPVAAETKRAPRAKTEDERPGSGMCWRHDGRGTSLVPCSEAPTGRRAY